jgi:hypothetical protein
MGDTIVYDDKMPVAYVRGIVVPLGRKPVSATDIVATFQNALALEYDGADQSKIGLTMYEAGVVEQAKKFADGDLEAGKFLTDRVAGKAVQQVNSFNVNANLKDFLAGLAKKRQEVVPPAIDPLGA